MESNTFHPEAFESIYRSNKKSRVKRWFFYIIGILIAVMLLPWTQNIKVKGKVTSLYQEHRPQEINAPIGGMIARWWVKEGDLVKKGDTLVQLTEFKTEYLDPNLVKRTQEQADAKEGSIAFYTAKVEAISLQLQALEDSKTLKLEQLRNKQQQIRNKLEAEQAELNAAENELVFATDQYQRQQKLYKEGLVSTTQMQQRELAYRNATAKKISAENKLAQTRREAEILRIEQNSIIQDYTEKISKAQSEKYQSLSQIASTQAELAKVRNQTSNYAIRNKMYMILAPQDGQIVSAKKSGLGEMIKEGESLALIVPKIVEHAVEMYVRPVDLPLVSTGQKVRFMFDGFPAIVFSGWPRSSYGTFGGKVVAVENSIGENGFFRVLVAEDTTDKKWPPELKMGSGAQGIALLKDVQVWYELWRNINGFPPDYYRLPETGLNPSQNKNGKSKP